MLFSFNNIKYKSKIHTLTVPCQLFISFHKNKFTLISLSDRKSSKSHSWCFNSSFRTRNFQQHTRTQVSNFFITTSALGCLPVLFYWSPLHIFSDRSWAKRASLAGLLTKQEQPRHRRSLASLLIDLNRGAHEQPSVHPASQEEREESCAGQEGALATYNLCCRSILLPLKPLISPAS